jgi:hypothetical protein
MVVPNASTSRRMARGISPPVPWSGIYGPGNGRPTYINCPAASGSAAGHGFLAAARRLPAAPPLPDDRQEGRYGRHRARLGAVPDRAHDRELKIFYSKADYNAYAVWLQSMGAPAVPHRWALTVIDIVLGVSVALHIGSAAELALRARRARPVRYAGGRLRQGYASRTMRTGAVLVVIFVAYHLLDLTFLVINRKGIAGDPDGSSRHTPSA